MSAPTVNLELVARLGKPHEYCKSGQFNETQVRRESLDPFFKAIHWDIHSVRGFAEAWEDIRHQDPIRVGGATKAPDCGFALFQLPSPLEFLKYQR